MKPRASSFSIVLWSGLIFNCNRNKQKANCANRMLFDELQKYTSSESMHNLKDMILYQLVGLSQSINKTIASVILIILWKT